MRCLLEERLEVSGRGPQAKPQSIEVLQYPLLSSPELPYREEFREVGTSGSLCALSTNHNLQHSDARDRVSGNIAEEVMRKFEAGREQGIQEGRELQRQEQLAVDRAAKKKQATDAAVLVQQFAQQREQYFERAERAVARLAFAIAERVLFHEVKANSLLLLDTVRTALSELAANTKVHLHVPAEDADLWREALGDAMDLKVRPAIIADEGLHCGDCVLKTELGYADLGVDAQLSEIVGSLFNDSPGKTSPDNPRNQEAQK